AEFALRMAVNLEGRPAFSAIDKHACRDYYATKIGQGWLSDG
ncbi:unnamed protein product, partial [marine sediment metagenome]